MSNKIEQLNKDTHKKVKLKPNTDFSHLENQHMAPVVIHEFGSVATELPIVFVKNELNNDEFMAVAMLGLKENENLLVKDKKWVGYYLPASFTHYPLSLMPNPEDNNQYIIHIISDSECVNEKEGEALFNEDGSETEFFTSHRQALENLFMAARATVEFVKTLSEMDMFEARTINFAVGEDKRSVTGVYTINFDKFNQLGEKEFNILKEKGYLSAIFAHFISINQIQRLINRIND